MNLEEKYKKVIQFKKNLKKYISSSFRKKYFSEPELFLVEEDTYHSGTVNFFEEMDSLKDLLENEWIGFRTEMITDFNDECPKFLKYQSNKEFDGFVNYMNREYPFPKDRNSVIEFLFKDFLDFLDEEMIKQRKNNQIVSSNVPLDVAKIIDGILYLKNTKNILLASSSVRTGIQFVIRNYTDIKEHNLEKELNQFYNKNLSKFKKNDIDIKEIQAIRKVGNFSVHPDKDIVIEQDDVDLVYTIFVKVVNAFFSPDIKEATKEKIDNLHKKYTRN